MRNSIMHVQEWEFPINS